MTRLCLVRHAQTDWNLQHRWQGQADPPLSLAGREQARMLARELTGEHFDAIYSSDLQRALATARAVAGPHRLPVQTDLRLREVNLGKWEGLLGEEIPALYPREWAARENDPFHARPPDGESVLDVARRAMPVFTELRDRHPSASLLIVSHGLLLAVFLCQLHNLPLDEAYNHIPENARPLFVSM